jgi:hypothetical protein
MQAFLSVKEYSTAHVFERNMLYFAEKLSDLRCCLQGRKDHMPTLEELEARLEALEQRVLPVLRGERTPETRKLEAQVNEQIRELRQQLAEQQRRLSAHEQSTQQKFETLTDVILQQSQALSQQLSVINAQNTDIKARFGAQDASTQARFEEQTTAIRAQFESISAPLMLLTVTTQTHNQHIGELRGQIDQRFEATNQQITEVRQDMNDRFEALEHGVNSRFDAQGQVLQQILARLPQQP